MSKKSKSTLKDTSDTKKTEELNETPFEAPENDPQDVRTVIIRVDYMRNIVPLYPVSDIKVSLKYLNQDIGESQVIPVTDNERLLLNESFDIQVDVHSTKQIDQLASSPVIVTAIQSSGSLDTNLYEQLQVSQEEAKPAESVDSLFSLYEAFNGERPSVQLSDMKKKKKGKKEKDGQEKAKSSSKSLTSKTSKQKSSKSSTNSDRSKSKSEIPHIKSEIYGLCVIDLIPLFYGKVTFSETLFLQPINQSCLTLSTFKNFPEIAITVSTKDNVKLFDIRNIFSFTVESICNIPSLMSTDMDCKVCALLPLENNGSSPTIFYNPKITSKEPNEQVPKRWPGIHDIGYNANTTKYFVEDNLYEITNKAHLDLKGGFKEGEPRIEFNYLKRNIVSKNGNNDFSSHIRTYQKLVLEIFLTPKSKKSDQIYGDIEELSPTKSRGSKQPPYLHLMAVLDVVALLYPGVTKLHIAAPVTTFTFDEAAKAGLHDSIFMPKPSLMGDKPSKLDFNKKKKPDKKEKTSKKDKVSTVTEDKNLTSQLPPRPEDIPIPEPSVQVYNEDGKPCFIIVELELLNPLTPKRDIEELKAELYQLQMEALQSSKTIINKHVADDLYNQTIKEIVDDLNKNWIKYNDLKNTIPQPDYRDFIEYLQKTGSYQTYLNSIITSATVLITNKYKCEERDFQNSKTYQNLVSEIFTDLVSQMHSVLNNLVCSGMKPITEKYDIRWDISYFYAKEAAELKLYTLADRYFMERIVNNDKSDPSFWFDYAIFNLEIDNIDKAFECLKESIAINTNDNKYALLLFGLLMADKQMIHEAETCLLNVMIGEAKWAEGWCILYLFYQKCGRQDGMEMALDRARKLKDDIINGDYFYNFEDLAWGWKHNIPVTMFFKTAILLLKMRLYSWVELALAEEALVPKYFGYVNYLLAVVSYYRRDFDHALEHIAEAKEHLGADLSAVEVSGHVLMEKGNLQEAKEEYFHIIESFDIPKDIHMVYLNCAEALAQLGEQQKARKLLLIACQSHQTPQVWFRAGKLYYLQNDMLSAEECFNEANMKDNRYAEVWGYLTLVNLKLSRIHEAEQCYQQAILSDLDNEMLLRTIMEEFRRVNDINN